MSYNRNQVSFQQKTRDRVMEVSRFIIENNSTVRETAKHMGVSKATIHLDLVKKLPYIDKEVYKQVRLILDSNIKVRHIRGGEANKIKIMSKKERIL